MSRIRLGWSRNWRVSALWTLRILVVCLLFGADNLTGVPSRAPNHAQEHLVTIEQLPAIPRRKAQVLAADLVSPSLEMKENVDFLLTPAIMVQEAMSLDVVPTYPTE